MKHLEVQPITPQAVKSQAPQKRSLSRTMLIALLLIAGTGYGMTTWWNPLPMDHVTDKEKTELVSRFTHLRSVTIEQIKDQDVDTVLDSMRLDPSSRQALKSSLEKDPVGSPATVLAEIVLWDFAAQDGDVVRVSSAGYEVDVPLLKSPATIAVPVDASRSIQLTGVRDGGGGITVGVQSGPENVSLPVLTEGQAFRLPVAF